MTQELQKQCKKSKGEKKYHGKGFGIIKKMEMDWKIFLTQIKK